MKGYKVEKHVKSTQSITYTILTGKLGIVHVVRNQSSMLHNPIVENYVRDHNFETTPLY